MRAAVLHQNGVKMEQTPKTPNPETLENTEKTKENEDI
jgi:hypothetical protein